jgi:hypothetical protein
VATTRRYWRISVTDAANPDTYIEVGELYLGGYLELTENYVQGFSQDPAFLMDTNISPYGVERDRFYNQQITAAMNDVWGEVRQAVDHMSDRLNYTEDGDKKKFHNTLVSNMLDVVDKMSAYNLSNDVTMDDARFKLSNALRGVTAENLRQDPHLRVETKRRVDEVKRIIDNIPGLGF